MILMLARHKVKDSAVFREGYLSESVISIRVQFGVTNDSTWVTIQDENDVLVIHYFENEAVANDFLNSKDLQDAMMQLGVLEPPKIQLFNKLV